MEEAEKLIGTTTSASGQLFNRKQLPEQKYRVLDVRKSTSKIGDVNNKSIKKDAVEYLLWNDLMSKPKWTLPFPIN